MTEPPHPTCTGSTHPIGAATCVQIDDVLPAGALPQSREARHLFRSLRQRVVKAGEAPLVEGELPEAQDDAVGGKTRQTGPVDGSSKNYAVSA